MIQLKSTALNTQRAAVKNILRMAQELKQLMLLQYILTKYTVNLKECLSFTNLILNNLSTWVGSWNWKNKARGRVKITFISQLEIN